ncbi:class D beta-lactamase [Candidatus Omnitrophota bacterium]
MKIITSFIFVMLLVSQACAFEWNDSAEVEALFNDAGIKGTFVLYDAEKDVCKGYNKERAYSRFTPASTFKIPNTLIGLSVGAVKSVDDILPYGGGECFLDVWEKDMSLRDAIIISNVPIYQELARRIGLDKMRENVAKLNYGNKRIGEAVDTFWLSGPLEISAVEQVVFLGKLARRELPFSQEAQAAVSEITLAESGEGWSIHAKTGMTTNPKPGVGWWVGWVTKDDSVYSFALNIEVYEFRDKDKRIPLGKAALEKLGIIKYYNSSRTKLLVD